MNALAFRNTQFDIVDRNGQPWLQSRQIAQALGYADEAAVGRLYRRNADEFTPCMSETVSLTVSGNLQKEMRIFSLRGAHLLAMFARTEVAKEFRRWVLDVLDSTAASAALPAPIEQQDLTLDYDGRRLRIARLDGAPWIVAADLAHALQLRNSYSIIRRLPEQQQRKVLFGRQEVNIVSMDGVRRTLLAAEPARAEAFGKWLEQAVAFQQPAQATAPVAPTNEAIVRDLLMSARFTLHFDLQGRMCLRELEKGVAYLPSNQLAEKILDPELIPPRMLPDLLQSVTARLVEVTGNRLPGR